MPREPGDWGLSPERLQRFLRKLGQDEETAGQRYNSLQDKLAKYFENRIPTFLEIDPLTMANRTIDKVAAILDTGTLESREVEFYAIGVARKDLREEIRNYSRILKFITELVHQLRFRDREEIRDPECVESALGSLNEEDLRFIEDYYGIERKTSTQRRRACDIIKRLRPLYLDCCKKKGSTNCRI